MPITPTPSGTPIQPTSIHLPPMGMFTTAVTYIQKANSGNTTIVYNPVGYTPIAQEENHPSFGVYTKVQMAIDIPLVVLGSYVPKPADSFIGPDGDRYNVIKRQTVSIFFCRVIGWCPTLSLNLSQSVQYKQASASSSNTAARTVTHTDIGDPIAASIQPMTAKLAETFGTKNFEDHFLIYLASDPSGTGYTVMQAGDLFVDQGGTKYEVVEVHERNSLYFLPAFDCKKKL